MLRSTALGLSLALTLAAPAMAQESTTPSASPYVGVSAGYHDIFDNPLGDDGGAIVGGVVGVDVPVSANGVIVGVEGNFHIGTGVVDSDYGVAGRIGYKFPSGGVVYARAGYQWVNIDVNNLSGGLVDEEDLDVEDTADDYLVGVGGEFPVGGPNTRLRVGVDTVSFDTWRPNVAFVLGF